MEQTNHDDLEQEFIQLLHKKVKKYKQKHRSEMYQWKMEELRLKEKNYSKKKLEEIKAQYVNPETSKRLQHYQSKLWYHEKNGKEYHKKYYKNKKKGNKKEKLRKEKK